MCSFDISRWTLNNTPLLFKAFIYDLIIVIYDLIIVIYDLIIVIAVIFYHFQELIFNVLYQVTTS